MLVFDFAPCLTKGMLLSELIDQLGLQPHPEGGYYAETYRSGVRIESGGWSHSAATAIYYLLKAGDFSAFHRIKSDEMWHLYRGGPLHIHVLDPVAGYSLLKLGYGLSAGERPQQIVPAGAWFAAAPAPGCDYALCGCTVSPGFEFADFELAEESTLLAAFPDQDEIIRRFCRSTQSGENGK